MSEVPDKPDDMGFTMLDLTALMTGSALDFETGEPTTPLDLDRISELEMSPMTEEELAEYPELLSETEMRQILAEAKERGENVAYLEQVLDGVNDDTE